MLIVDWARRLFPAQSKLGRRLRMYYWGLQPHSLRYVHTLVLDALAASYGGIRFVQIGSNDAGFGDPLRFHILNSGWRGMMIEPLPFIFERLTKRYQAIDGLILENVAIDRESGERNFYHLREDDDPDLPPWYDQLGSFLKENVLKHEEFVPDIAERLVATPVRCASVDELCRKYGYTQFDLLHIDAEGYDHEILKSIDLARYRPKLVLFEHKHLASADYLSCLQQLHAAGYLSNADQVDTLALHKDVLTHSRQLTAAWSKVRRRLGADVWARHAGVV